MAQVLLFNNGDFESNAIKQVVFESNRKNVFTRNYALMVSCGNGGTLREYTAALTNTNRTWYCTIGSNTGKYKALSQNIEDEDTVIYPIPIPDDKTIINVKCTNYAPIFVFYDINSKATGLPSSYRECAKVVGGETPSGGTPYSIVSWTYDERTISIPEGATGFTIGFNNKSEALHDAFDLSKVTITLL